MPVIGAGACLCGRVRGTPALRPSLGTRQPCKPGHPDVDAGRGRTTVTEDRIPAAVDAGGRVVDDENAPSFVVLTDVEGNEAWVCTFLDR